MARRRNILFLIRSLSTGGAERQLVALANGLAVCGHAVSVAVFYGGGELEADLCGVTMHDLSKSGRWDVLGFFFRLIRLVRTLRPQILHGYLGTANLLTVLAKPFAEGARVVWGVRSSGMDLSRYDWLWRLSGRLEALGSRFADRIIVNSKAGMEVAAAQGFCRERLVHVPNGIDTDLYRPDRASGLALRREWGIPEDALLVGHVGRLDPMKDHETFLLAAALAGRKRAELRFICVGGGNPKESRRLFAFADSLDLGRRLTWAGLRRDMPAVYNAFDVLCLSSAYGEGFPNAVGEAMACAVPCVVTDVGDAALLVGDTGEVAPPRAPESLSAALLRLLERKARESGLGQRARQRTVERFGLERLVERSEKLLQGLAGGG